MFEINPILSGKFSAPDYTAATSNVNAGPDSLPSVQADDQNVTSTHKVDPRRYTKFDRTATEAGTAELSFSDILDAINPLQHIPVLSSIYRAVAGEDINPVSRVTGDLLYGGIMGLGSAVIGAIGSIGNSMMIAETGQSVAGNMTASLLGIKGTAGSEKTTALASATPNPSNITTVSADNPLLDASAAASLPVLSAALESPAQKQPEIALEKAPEKSSEKQTIDIADAESALLQASEKMAAARAGTLPSTSINSDIATNGAPAPSIPPSQTASAKAFPLDRSKLPFGGVMDMSTASIQQTVAQSLAQGKTPTLQLGHTIYTNKFMTGAHAPVAATKPAALPQPSPQETGGASAKNSDSTSATTSNALNYKQPEVTKSLIDDLMALRELKKYPAVAGTPSTRGTTVDLAN